MLVYNASRELCKWAGLKLWKDENAFNPASAIGISRNNKIIAAVVYNNYVTTLQNEPLLCEMTIVSVDKRWATRHNLHALFAYPFHQLQLKRVQAICSADDEGVQQFLKKVGFTYEGTHRQA